MGPRKIHQKSPKKTSSFDFAVNEDSNDGPSLKFVVEEDSEILQENHGNHALQDITLENLQQVFQNSKPSDAFSNDQEDSYQLILDVEKHVLSFSDKFDDFSMNVDSFESGVHYQLSDIIKLEKGCKHCVEEWIRTLEKLESIVLEEFQIVEKSKKNNLVYHTNSLMDLADKLMPRIETLKSNSVLQQGNIFF